MNCASCGASLENDLTERAYKCEYCGSYNYNDKYIEERFANLNTTKATDILEVAKVRFASGRYEEAIDLITESLKENNDCVEAWATLALCRIYTLSTSNFEKNVRSIEQCNIKIEGLDREHAQEYLLEIQQKLLAKALELSFEWVEKSKTVYAAYASTDPARAKQSAGRYSLLAIGMINDARRISNEHSENSVQASICILVAVCHLKILKGDPRFDDFKSDAQNVVRSAFKKNKTNTKALITNLGLTPSEILVYAKDKSKDKTTKATKRKRSGPFKTFIKWIVIFVVGFILLGMFFNR